MYFVFQIERLHAASQTLCDFALESRICMNDVPTLGHELCASGYSEIAEYPVQSHSQDVIHEAKIEAEKENSNDHYNGCAHNFLTAGPGDLLHLAPNIGVK